MPIKSLGRLVATHDANGHVNEMRYNAAGAVLAEIHADSGIERHGYDVFGDQIRTTDELGYNVWSTYDAASRIKSVRREVDASRSITEVYGDSSRPL